jgi:hypothetical protein
MRYLVAIIGFGIIVIRIVFPEWKIDNTTLILFVFSSLLLTINSKYLNFSKLRELFESIKIGNIDLKFREMNEDLIQVEETTTFDSKLRQKDYEFLQASWSVSGTPDTDPHLEIVNVAQEIESFISDIWYNSNLDSEKSLSIINQVQKLNSNNVIDDKLSQIITKYWKMRNRVVHEIQFKLSGNKLYLILDTGYRILRILRAIEASTRKNQD